MPAHVQVSCKRCQASSSVSFRIRNTHISLLWLSHPLIWRDVQAVTQRDQPVSSCLQLSDCTGQNLIWGTGVLLVLQHDMRRRVGPGDLRVHGIAGIQRCTGTRTRYVVPVDGRAEIACSQDLQVLVVVISVWWAEESRATCRWLASISRLASGS